MAPSDQCMSIFTTNWMSICYSIEHHVLRISFYCIMVVYHGWFVFNYTEKAFNFRSFVSQPMLTKKQKTRKCKWILSQKVKTISIRKKHFIVIAKWGFGVMHYESARNHLLNGVLKVEVLGTKKCALFCFSCSEICTKCLISSLICNQF